MGKEWSFMKEVTYLDKARNNYRLACDIIKTYIDEGMLNLAGYHLQQSVELALKHALMMNGIDFPKVHDISQLIQILQENELSEYVNDYIDEHSEMFTMWESKTRYILSYSIERRKVEKAIREVGTYLDLINQKIQQDQTMSEDETISPSHSIKL